MKLADIIKLIDAGYTRADIEAMAAETEAPEVKPAEQSQTAENNEQQPPEKGEEKNAAGEAVNAAMLQELRDLKNAVYAMNIMNTSQPEPVTVDDVLMKALKEG